MIIAQITDTHLKVEGSLAFGRIDTTPFLDRCIESLDALDPAPDLVLHTGDLVERRTPEEYDRFRRLTAGLRFPFFAIPGNHDAREPMRAAYRDAAWMPPGGDFLHYAIEGWPVRILMLDSIIPGKGSGELCEERLTWLEARLAEQPRRPTIVALHHPPFRTGIAQIDRGGFGNAARFEVLLKRFDNIERVICGHVHRPITTRFGGTIASSAPAVAYQFDLDLREEAPLSLVMEPPGFALHTWQPDHGLVSHLVPLGEFDGPFPFLKDGKMIPVPPAG